MSISPEGRTRGIFPGLKPDFSEAPHPSELIPSIDRRLPWGDVTLFIAELVPTVTLATGFIANNPALWAPSAIVLAAEGVCIYLHNMSEFMQSPPQKT